MSPSGWVALDKPVGHTSHDVVAIARKRLGIRKIGHSGTLDPDVTGVLLLAVNQATRLIQFLQPIKAYQATIGLGMTTSTQDGSGEILTQHPVPALTRTSLAALLETFQGVQWQTPPMVSAVSWQGKRLYEWARQGIEIAERPARQITLHRLTLGEITPESFELHVICSSGTYIRTLAHDIGEKLGCGAYLKSLRRTMTNGIDAVLPLAELTAQTPLLALDAPLQHLPLLTLTASEGKRLQQGQIVPAPDARHEPQTVRLYAPDLIGLGLWEHEHLKAQVILAY